MQRQSLGSPVAKLHLHANGGGVTEGSPVKEDQKRKDIISCLLTADEDENKSQKLHKPSTTKPEKFIHLIPLLTVICFLVLYLSSHDPSQKDLAQFNGFHQLLLKPTDSTEIDDFGRVLEENGKSGDVLEIRSVRNLQELGRHDHRRRHRKIKIDGF
ncbi:uncharacterized protein LOC124910251 [Impatiens glandulifera]|uniref:uncharacterized protein LOC124910251 n=1 Tax=Impatiens glandulifera TaxID=253017 RepID=UPI001FB13AFF|nr:uncharacterized protein LOC124910251 [Impatiens glandulifera]